MVTTHEILKAAAALPDAERIELIEALLESFAAPAIDPAGAAAAWQKLAADRAAELDRGVARAIPWDEVRLEGERRIDGRSSS